MQQACHELDLYTWFFGMPEKVFSFTETYGLDNPNRTPGEAIHSGAASAAVTDTAGHEVLLTDFINSVHDDREPLITGDSAKLATELALRIYGKLV